MVVFNLCLIRLGTGIAPVKKNTRMKKLLFALCLVCFTGAMANAQDVKKKKTETPTVETKVKKTSTPTQKVHNVVHPNHKKYSGVKTKTEVKKNS